MTTTHASSHAPKPAEAASRPQQGNARANADKAAEGDLFASLLGLAADTLPAAATTPLDSEAGAEAAAEADDKTQNPLAALFAWTLPAAPAAAATGTDATHTPANPTIPDGTAKEGGIDITGMTRVDEALPPLPTAAAQARAATASRPAFSPLHPNAAHAATTLSSAGQRAQDGNVTVGGAPAMVWQRGAVSSTEALQQQHSAQFAQVRATVALNERLGLSSGSEPGATPASTREFAVGGPGGTLLSAASQDGSLAAASGASGDTGGSGDNASNTSAEQGQGDGRPHAEAGAEAEGPTVSHWGTQHLRHASLRVGDGGADAIDIQLAVKGQEVQVAFQTDNAEARATLRENAGAALGELMQRSGIQLGGVSVGSQGQSQGDGSHHARSTGLSTEAPGRSGPAAEPASRPVMGPRADGSRPLDVFA
jgi:flagellar hook-length control protein FliK